MFVCLFVCLFVRLFVCSVVLQFVRFFVCSFVRPSVTFFTPSKICGIDGGSRYGFDTVANEVDGEVTEEIVD